MAARFPTTRWSRILRAGDPADPVARSAIEDLCRDYWFPLYAFVRRHGVSADDAEDIVQGFFADVLERGDLLSLDQSKGRFRAFLRAVRLRPGEAIFHFYLAGALLQKEGKWGESLTELKEAQSLPSRNASPWLTERLATVLFNLRERDQAVVLLRDLERIHHVGPRTNLPMFLDRFGRFLLEIAGFDEGLAKIREALRLRPDEPAYLCSLGEAHFA
jgi:tetratricopeptide (TPR) repeat protein